MNEILSGPFGFLVVRHKSGTCWIFRRQFPLMPMSPFVGMEIVDPGRPFSMDSEDPQVPGQAGCYKVTGIAWHLWDNSEFSPQSSIRLLLEDSSGYARVSGVLGGEARIEAAYVEAGWTVFEKSPAKAPLDVRDT